MLKMVKNPCCCRASLEQKKRRENSNPYTEKSCVYATARKAKYRVTMRHVTDINNKQVDGEGEACVKPPGNKRMAIRRAGMAGFVVNYDDI